MTPNDNTGQETTSDNLTPLEKEAKEWEAKQKIAEAEKAIAQANLDRLKMQLPSGTTKPVEGKINTDDKSGYAAELAAYNAMRQKARIIADIITEKGKDKIGGILLADSLDYCAGDVQLIQISTQIDSFSRLIENQIKKFKVQAGIDIEALVKAEETGGVLKFAISPILPFIPQVISAAADVLGYFRMDYDVKGKTITKSDTAFRAMVANYLRYPVYLPGFHRIEKSELLEDFNQCYSKRNALVLGMARLNKVISAEAAAKPKGSAKKGETKPSPKEMLYAESEALVKTIDDFGKTITSISAGSTYSPLAAATLREHFNKYAKQKEITHLLYLTVTSAGGEEVTGHGPFSLCGKIWYMGGCVVNYFLADMSGKIVAADAISETSYVHYSLWAKRLSGFTTSADYLKPKMVKQ